MWKVGTLVLALVGGCHAPPAGDRRAVPAAAPSVGCDGAVPLERARTAEDAVRAIACRPVSARGYQMVYARFDEERPNPFLAAVVLASCHRSGACWYATGARGDVLPFLPGAAATRYELARSLDVDAVTSRVLSLRVPRAIQRRFMQRVQAARKHLLAVVPRLDVRWKRVYVAPVQKTRHRWRAAGYELESQLRAWRALRDEVDGALANDTFNLSHRLRLEALRQQYVESCRLLGGTTVECLGQRVPREAAALIARVADALDDPLTAQTERALLHAVPDRSRLAYALHAAVADAMNDERARYAAYDAARKQAADPQALRDRFGDPPPLDLTGQPNGAGVAPPRSRPATVRLPVRRHREVVQTIERDGDEATLILSSPESRRRGRVRVPLADAREIQRGEVVDILYRRADGAGVAAGRVVRVFGRDAGASNLRQIGPYRL